MAGFVECLDNEEAEEGTEKEDGERETSFLPVWPVKNVSIWYKSCCLILYKLNLRIITYFITPKQSDSDPQKKVARIRHETQIHILNLLITSLELKTPNLALYLLGYEVKKPVSSTNLQDPGQTPALAVGMFILLAVVISAILVGFWFEWKRDQMSRVLSFSWWCICVLQVCWDAHGAACTPSWVCCRGALRRDQDLCSHSRPHT